MQTELDFLEKLLRKGLSPHHAAKAAAEELEAAGFTALDPAASWDLAPGKYYFVYATTVIAFVVHGPLGTEGFRLAAAHIDWPCMRVKPAPEISAEGYGRLNAEPYGGLINYSWLDRPLGAAGVVCVKGESPFAPQIRLFASEGAIAVAPSLAIHQNREVNKSAEFNRQVDLLPLALRQVPEGDSKWFYTYLAERLGCAPEDILDFDLSLYNAEEPCAAGLDGSLYSAPRLDDLTCAAAGLWGILRAERSHGVSVCILFDHEEIGNGTRQGAGSVLLPRMLEKIAVSLGDTPQEAADRLMRSFLLSMDVGHAVHPAHPEKADLTNRPRLGAGVLIKTASAQSYATDPAGISVVEGLCRAHDIPHQRFVNRSDVTGGGTLGNAAAEKIPALTVDVGIPLLAMHSARELMAAQDQQALCSLVTAFYREES